MKLLRLASVVVGVVVSSGCYSTVYLHLEPTPEHASMRPPSARPPGDFAEWQHYFLSGWVPSEHVIYAADQCGGPDRVAAIRTEQTFGQAATEALTWYYISVYSPHTAKVICVDDLGR